MQNPELFCIEQRELNMLVFYIVMIIIALSGTILVLIHDKGELKEKIRELKKEQGKT